MSDFPHRVVIELHKLRFSELLDWLRDQGHELRRTVIFGGSHHSAHNNVVVQSLSFKDADAAMLFKLAWGGR